MRLALASLAAAALILSVPAASEQSTRYQLIDLEKGWRLLIDSTDFDDRGRQKSGSLTSYTYVHKVEHILLWVHLERTGKLATTEGCKARMYEKIKAGEILGSADDSISTRGDAIIAVSLLNINAQVAQGHAFTCRTNGHTYIIVQVAKMHYQPSDRETLFAIADRVRLLDPDAEPNPDIF